MQRKPTIRGSRILVVDDHRNIRLALRHALEGEGARVEEAETVAQAREKLGAESGDFPWEAVLCDIRLPDGNGLDILRAIADREQASRVIMISGEGTVAEAFQSTKDGAFDYIEKPFTPERIIVSVTRLLRFHSIQATNAELTKTVMKGQEILGAHPTILELRQAISQVAPTNGRILILGESGTGKELVAKAVHRESERKHLPLIKVNCAAIPHSLVESELFGHEKGSFTGASKSRRGLFEQAHGGTLFLDEIGELSLDVQAKLLRVLQNGELIRVGGEKPTKVDVRLLAATNRDLESMIENNEFREDLYYRLNVISLKVPPLRDRGEDIVLLAKHMLEEMCEEHSLGYRYFTDNALKQIAAWQWPGNIRELRNIVERSAIMSETQQIDTIPDITRPETPGAGAAPPDAGTSTDSPGADEGGFSFQCDLVSWQEMHASLDKAYIKFVLGRSGGNVSEAARKLCLERAYLHRLMKKLGIQRGVVVKDQ